MPTEQPADAGDEQPRNIATVFVELAEARAENDADDRRWQQMNDGADRDQVSDRMAARDDDILRLEREARERIAKAAGVPWSAIERAAL